MFVRKLTLLYTWMKNVIINRRIQGTWLINLKKPASWVHHIHNYPQYRIWPLYSSIPSNLFPKCLPGTWEWKNIYL
jgi:hypothetical protein